MSAQIEKIVIAGGGLAGWMAAAMLSKAFSKAPKHITVIEDDTIKQEGATIGAGLASMESLRAFNGFLGLNEHELLKRTQGCFSLGTQFRDWRGAGGGYFLPFGDLGVNFGAVQFHQVAQKLAEEGAQIDLADYSPAAQAAKKGRFVLPQARQDGLPSHSYGLHVDRFLYRNGLRAYAMQAGVKETSGQIAKVNSNDAGLIEYISLDNGQRIEGDLFVDCTGSDARLMRGVGDAAFDDWRGWLPCDRVVEITAGAVKPPSPYSSAVAVEGGWLSEIPLQHCTSHRYYYSSEHAGDDAALQRLQNSLAGPAVTDPVYRKIPQGRLRKPWSGNCIAIGDAACVIEPLASAGLHLVQSGLFKLIGLFPFKGCDCGEAEEYNRQLGAEIDRIRDFVILHYFLNGREGEAFWDAQRRNAVPEPLQHQISLFRSQGVVSLQEYEPFTVAAWVMAFYGNGVIPQRYDPIADSFPSERCRAQLQHIRTAIAESVNAMPHHGDYIMRHCMMRAPGAAQGRGGAS